MIIGIISEDKYDCEALSIIVKKILGDDTVIIPAHRYGKDAIIHQKKLLASKVFNFNCETVLIVRDSDGGDVNAIVKSLREAYDSTPISSKYKICIAVEELEAWFLSDINSVASTYSGLSSTSLRISESNVDDIHNPKDKLKSYITKESKGRAQYIPSDTIRMANNMDVDTARKKSKSFDHFYETVASLA